MKLILRISIFLFSVLGFSQEAFEPGFYIDNQGNQVNGMINNENWFNTPDFIFFKSSESADAEKLDLMNIRLFEINNNLRYEKHRVQVDTKPISNYKENNSSNSEPVYDLKTVFLKVLVKGEANLFQYTSFGNSYYYYKTERAEKIVPLVYKKFIDSNGRERENADFRKVLFENLSCDSQDINKFLKIKYASNELLEVFEEYNKCKQTSFVVYKKEEKKSKFNATAFVGYVYSTYKSSSPYSKENISRPVFGAELSLVLPHKNYRHEIFSKIYYENVDAKNSSKQLVANSSSYFIDELKSDYSAIGVLLGTRYNFFIDEGRNKLFIDASFGTNFISGEITYTRSRYYYTSGGQLGHPVDLITQTAMFFNVGFGYVFNDKFGIDLRYNLVDTGNIAVDFYEAENDKNTITTSLRYTFL